jgi:hypothetical protein
MGSGDVSVLARQRVIALCEEAACAAVAGELELGGTSVGTWIELEHLPASQIGAEVVAVATLKPRRWPPSGVRGDRCRARWWSRVVATDCRSWIVHGSSIGQAAAPGSPGSPRGGWTLQGQERGVHLFL